MLKFDVLTLFPEMFQPVLNESILKRARQKGLIQISIHNIRDFATSKHRITDDYPFGGGGGMVLKPEPVIDAIERICGKDTKATRILLSPQGNVFDQEKAEEISKQEHIMLICGHYEGFDARISDYVDEELSIGDFVLTGGEIPAMVIIDSSARLIPGVLGNENSFRNESFSTGLLDFPQFTRPRVFRGKKVPEILLSGNHRIIENWRRKEALRTTVKKRPHLLEKVELTKEDKMFLKSIQKERQKNECN